MKTRSFFLFSTALLFLSGCITVEVVDNRETTTITESMIVGATDQPSSTPKPSITSTIELPTRTPAWTPSPFLTSTPEETSTPTEEAERLQFSPGTSIIRLADHLSGKKRYVFRAFADQVATMAVFPKDLKLSVWDQDGTILKSPDDGLSFWRGTLPASHNYFIELGQDGEVDFDLTVIVNPLGKTVQWIGYRNDTYNFELMYPDYFVAERVTGIPLTKGVGVLKLDFVDSMVYQGTNLDEVSFVVGASDDPAIVETCTDPASEYEEMLADETVGEITFTKSMVRDVSMGHVFERMIYRTGYRNVCYEIVFHINYTGIEFFDQSVINAFDREVILEKLNEILATFEFS